MTSTSTALNELVNQDKTTTTNITSASPLVFGQSVTFTAAVNANTSQSGTPTGTVTFYDDSTLLATVTMTDRKASLTISTLSVGSHSIAAVYDGDANHAMSTSATLSEVVEQDATTTTVISSVSPSGLAQPVTFTATVSAGTSGSGTPTGSVLFKEGDTVLGIVNLNATGTATYSTTTLSLGSHIIAAVYSGDHAHYASSSTSLQMVQKATTTTLATSLSTSTYSQKITLTAVVTATASSKAKLTGNVTFYDGNTVLGTAAISSGKAKLTIATLSAGTHTITAKYSGDATFAEKHRQHDASRQSGDDQDHVKSDAACGRLWTDRHPASHGCTGAPRRRSDRRAR